MTTASLGAVTRELIREAIVAICEQMSLAVIRTSHSETVKSAMDFSTAICDATGEMVGQGVTLPNQLGAIPDAIAQRSAGARGRSMRLCVPTLLVVEGSVASASAASSSSAV